MMVLAKKSEAETMGSQAESGKAVSMTEEEIAAAFRQGTVLPFPVDRVVHTGYQPLSSVAWIRDTKGNWRPEIKVYNEDPKEAYRIALELMEQAEKDVKA